MSLSETTAPWRADYGAVFHRNLAGFMFTVTPAIFANDVARALNAEAARAEGVDTLQDPNLVHINMLRGSIAKLTPAQVGHLYRGDEAAEVIREVARQNPEAEGVAALQQAGEPECWRVKEGWGDWSKFWHDRQNAERLESKGWTIQALYASPLPQQTALVEEGVEEIIGPHEPAACGASAPSEAPRSDGVKP